MKLSLSFLAAVLGLASASAATSTDLFIADFEGTNYGSWRATGGAFGNAPARGTLPGQMNVDGFLGKRLVNSFVGGDRGTGTLTSAAFKIERRYITFLIGGGGYSNETCVNLLVDGKPARTAVGPNVVSGGSEHLVPGFWDVGELAGREAVIEIVDRRAGGWGHINVDHLVQSDRKPVGEQRDVTREIAVTQRYLHLPVKTGATQRKVELLVNGTVERFFDIELADGDADWFAFVDVSAWQGRKLTVKVNKLREDSQALELVSNDDAIKGAANLYAEDLRPQLHFSAKRGWLNDPNGLVFYRGEYHLFLQHNPYGWGWGNMHWGHAVSTDLTHWKELPEALYPDAMGPMFSGSAVVDWKNSSGLGRNGEPPLVLLYTAAGDPAVQCIASSVDGRSFTKFEGNPVVKQITGGNRDPKVIWHEPTKRWVMTLYVGFDENKDGKKNTRHTIHFLTSPNLKEWTVASQVDGFFECPDFFPLAVDGDPKNIKWVLTAASSEYRIGSFDGTTFTAETGRLAGHRGKGFYAAQTFSDLPDGRRIQIGWLQAPSPGMAFNQCMSLPLELKLTATAEGPRLTWAPLPTANDGVSRAMKVKPEETVRHDHASGLMRVTAEFEPGADSELNFTVNGAVISYAAAKQELTVNGHRAPAPLRNGKQRLTIIADRTVLEVFASDGLTYVPMPVIAKAGGASVSLTGAALKSQNIQVAGLRSIWK